MDYITLGKKSVLKFGIKDENGNDTGKVIEIDVEDIDFAFRANECQIEHENNIKEFEEKIKEIDENCSADGKFPTERDLARREACQEFMKKEEKAIDDFIGEGTTRKLLNGRKPYVLMFNDIIDALSQMIPSLKNTSKQIVRSIKDKYDKNKEEGNNVI